MKECLHCKEKYEPRREHSKFCSTSCRVMYNRKHPQEQVTKVQMQAMYNFMMDAIAGLNAQNGLPPPATVVIQPHDEKAPEISYNIATDGLLAATSSAEIENIWRKVLAKKDWPGWQLTQLTRIKENQRTKIDF